MVALLSSRYIASAAVPILLLLTSSPASAAPLCRQQDLAPSFNLTSYQGTWFEIASTVIQRLTFQKNCECTTATYTLTPENYVQVDNVCYDTSKNSVNPVIGKATPVLSADKPAFEVSFPGAPDGFNKILYEGGANYLLLKRDVDPVTGTEYAIIGAPCRLFAWILARAPKLSDEAYEGARNFLSKERGYPVTLLQLKKTNQDDDYCKPVRDYIKANVSTPAPAKRYLA